MNSKLDDPVSIIIFIILLALSIIGCVFVIMKMIDAFDYVFSFVFDAIEYLNNL